jgi:hypothetical protein
LCLHAHTRTRALSLSHTHTHIHTHTQTHTQTHTHACRLFVRSVDYEHLHHVSRFCTAARRQG